MTECQRKMSELAAERDSLVKQSNSAQRYLEGLPMADEHAANLRLVIMLPTSIYRLQKLCTEIENMDKSTWFLRYY